MKTLMFILVLFGVSAQAASNQWINKKSRYEMYCTDSTARIMAAKHNTERFTKFFQAANKECKAAVKAIPEATWAKLMNASEQGCADPFFTYAKLPKEKIQEAINIACTAAVVDDRNHHSYDVACSK